MSIELKPKPYKVFGNKSQGLGLSTIPCSHSIEHCQKNMDTPIKQLCTTVTIQMTEPMKNIKPNNNDKSIIQQLRLQLENERIRCLQQIETNKYLTGQLEFYKQQNEMLKETEKANLNQIENLKKDNIQMQIQLKRLKQQIINIQTNLNNHSIKCEELLKKIDTKQEELANYKWIVEKLRQNETDRTKKNYPTTTKKIDNKKRSDSSPYTTIEKKQSKQGQKQLTKIAIDLNSLWSNGLKNYNNYVTSRQH